ncbi:hypothetical protein ABH926_010143 [Catenulispora sp. GP43]|uniref:hypothetical protein n=1 Tax=Catenulispora sp. GP43 TaxID=3156263 RepID=UPI00351577E2
MLYGRSRIFDFAEAALQRTHAPVRPLPLVPLLGPHGAGGTAVLGRLAKLAADHPGAALDLAGAQDVGSVVFAAVHELGRQHIRGVRRVQHFPRLGVVTATLGYSGKPEDGQAFRAHVRDSLGTANLAATLESWTDRAAPLVATAAPPDLTRFLVTVLGALVSGVRAKRVDGLAESLGGYDLLRRQTNRWREGLEGEPGQIAQRTVDHLLVTAFISDLRADFNHGPSYNQRRSNAFLLLDNCDDQTAVEFLEHIADARRLAFTAAVEPDPLLVFAVQHGEFHDYERRPLSSTDPALVFIEPDRNERREDHPRLWLPVSLAPLVRPDVQAMIGTSPRGRIAQDTTFVLALTAGHPAATALVTKLMAEFGSATFDVPGILGRALPDELELPHIPRSQRGGTVLDVLLRTLIQLNPAEAPGADPSPIARLAVCAATDPLDPDGADAVFRYLRWPDGASAALDVFRAGLWLAPGAEPHLHPLLTRLLRRWLARFPALWTDVHQAYANYYGEKPGPQSMIHTLALVDPAHRDPLATVVSHLEREIRRRSKAQWHDHLAEITRAPGRMPVSDDPSNTVNQIAGIRDGMDLRRTIARLTVATWLHRDVPMDPYERLAPIVAEEDASFSAGFPPNQPN